MQASDLSARTNIGGIILSFKLGVYFGVYWLFSYVLRDFISQFSDGTSVRPSQSPFLGGFELDFVF